MALATAMRIAGDSQNLSISGSNASATITAQTTVRLDASTDCYIKFGAAATTNTSAILRAGMPEYFEPGTATTLQAITSGASGTLNITPMA